MTGGRLDGRQVLLVLGLLVIGVYVGWLMWLLQHGTYDEWGAMIIGPVLVLISLPILNRVSQTAAQPWLFGLASFALVVKLLASLVRYWVAFVYYDGVADAAGYDNIGRSLVESYRHGNFYVPHISGGAGTQFVQSVTGVIYAITGPSLMGGYLVYSWLGFWGLLLCYLAFKTAVPEGHHKRYAAMLFFLPSLLFWPSGIGKEAWMMLGLGLCAYGAARLLAHLRGGFLVLALGLLATGAVRPHVTLLVAVGLIVAYAVLPARRVTTLTPVVKVGGLVVLLVAGFLVLRQTASFLGVTDISSDGFEGALEEAQSQTDQGGSQFEGAAVTSPLGLPWAAVTVLFRPFPWEADSATALAAAAEGLLLLYLTWRYRHSLLSLPRLLRRMPYVTFSLTYLLGYIVAFAGFANFGILVRQRSLALPAFLVLLAVPELVSRGRRARGSTAVRHASSRAREVARR